MQCIPFIFVLMSNKSENIYTHLFEYIDKEIFSFKCASFMTDYETAMKNALKVIYPEIELRSCWFHFAQAVKKKSSQVANFRSTIQSNKAARQVY